MCGGGAQPEPPQEGTWRCPTAHWPRSPRALASREQAAQSCPPWQGPQDVCGRVGWVRGPRAVPAASAGLRWRAPCAKVPCHGRLPGAADVRTHPPVTADRPGELPCVSEAAGDLCSVPAVPRVGPPPRLSAPKPWGPAPPSTRAVGSEAAVPLGLAGLTPQPLLLGALLGKAAPIPGHPEPWPSECGERAAPRPVQ